MSTDGTYGFVYCGWNGLGIGVFTVRAGIVTGSDSGQVTYQGKATEQPDGRIDSFANFGEALSNLIAVSLSPETMTSTNALKGCA